MRLTGVGHSLPHEAHADERVWESQVAAARGASGPAVDDFARFYPDLLPRLHATLTPSVTVPQSGSADDHRAAARLELLRLRILGALLSLLLVPATYRIARLVLDRPASVLAAGLAGTSLLLQWHAQEARPHAAAASFVAISLVLLVGARRKPQPGRWIAAGLACAASMSVLQSALALLPAFAAAVLLADRTAPRGLRRVVGPVACVLAMATMLWFQPELAPQHDPGNGRSSMVRFAGHAFDLASLDGGGFALLFWKAWEFDPILLVLALAGVARLLVERPWQHMPPASRADALVVLAHAVPYALAIGLYSVSFERFLLPLLPVATVCAAAGVLGWRRPVRAVGALLAVLVLAVQSACTLKLALWRAKPHTIDQAARWLEQNVDPGAGSIAMLPFLDVPVLRTPASLRADARQLGMSKWVWHRWLAALPDAELDGRGYDMAALPLPETWEGRRALRLDPLTFVDAIEARHVVVARLPEQPLLSTLHAQVAARGTLVASFDSGWDRVGDRMARSRLPLVLKLSWLERAGPDVEIWRF